MIRNKPFSTILLITTFILSGCGEKTPTECVFTINDIDNVAIHTEKQSGYLNDTPSSIDSHCKNAGENSLPLAAHLSWNVSSDTGAKPKSYVVEVYETGLENEITSYTTKNNYFDLYNCKVDASYSYKVKAIYNGAVFISEAHSFTTQNEYPRNLLIEGTTNARDLGGRGNIVQGRIFRSAELNDGDATSYTSKITNNGIFELAEHLKIKTEIDVRKDSEIGKQSECAFGEDKNYIRLPMGYQGATQVMTYKSDTEDNLASIKTFFETLADNSNLPALFHCTYGRDRTGYLAWLVEGLCGASEDELYQDYLFTNFADVSAVTYSGLQGSGCYPNMILNKTEGETIKDKFYNYLSTNDKSHPGISTDILDAVINNLCN